MGCNSVEHMVTILRTESDNADFRGLVSRLDSELAKRDGSQHAFYHQFNGLEGLDRVVLAMEAGQAVGCGALKAYGQDSLEVKRMFTLTSCRGRGVGTAILKALEVWALEDGYRRIVLETGLRQPEAILLYEKSAYRRIANYGPYSGVANSVCFEKHLGSVDPAEDSGAGGKKNKK